MRVLPILFNTDMVRALLGGKKTVTRRAVRYKYSNTEMKVRKDKYGARLVEIQKDIEGETYGKHPDGRTWRKLLWCMEKEPPYKKGDTLYVRETWSFLPCVDCTREGTACGRPCVIYEDRDSVSEGCFVYRAGHPDPDRVSWSPSIHMPKAAARIWIKVTDVRVERLQDIDDDGIVAEGLEIGIPFEELWDATIRKPDRDRYGWDANPWVWVIEFERCEKPESEE